MGIEASAFTRFLQLRFALWRFYNLKLRQTYDHKFVTMTVIILDYYFFAKHKHKQTGMTKYPTGPPTCQ